MEIKKSVLQRIRTDALMLFVAVIWGSAFSAQQVAAETVGPFLVLGLRFSGAAFLLLLLMRFRIQIPKAYFWKTILAGCLLFTASAFQQIALSISSVGNAGFITGMYVIIIPLLLWGIWKEKLAWNVWAAVGLVVIGLYFLTNTGNTKFAVGDILLLICAFLYALQMIVLSDVVRNANPYHVATIQFLVAGGAGLVMGLLFEENSLAGVQTALLPLVYITIFSTTIAYTLQGVAQKTAHPTDAAIFLSMESVFAAVFGILLLGEQFSAGQLSGCVLMFTAMILSQISFNSKKNSAVQEAHSISQS